MAPDKRSGPDGGEGAAPEANKLRDESTSGDRATTAPHLDAALAEAAAGREVFPLKAGTKAGQLLKSWKREATSDPEQIREWWTRWPDANIAIATGARSGLVVVDVDGPDGETTLAGYGPIPATREVKTPRGRHLYLTHPGGTLKNTAKKLGPKLDTRGDGGYVVAPPSTRDDGTGYELAQDLPVAGMPPALAKVLNGTREETPKPRHDLDTADLFDRPGRSFTRAEAKAYVLEHAEKPLKEAQPGGRNHALNAAAMVYGHFIPAVTNEREATKRLTFHARILGLELDEILATIRSGLAAGMADPYTVTDDEHLDDEQAKVKRTQAILDAALDATDLDSLPEPVPLLPGYLNRSEYVLLSGKFGTYKSLVLLGWCYCVATGQGWSGSDPAEPAPVVYVAAEGITGFRRRLRALERRHGVKVPQGMLTVIRRPVHLANADEVAGLRQVIEQRQARLIALDTWHRMTPGIEENSATETGGPLDQLLALRDDYDTTVALAHHTGHAQRHARGSSALEDDADAAWIIRLGDGAEDAEDRANTTPRTLVQRKAKDGELTSPALLLLQVDDQGDATVDLDPIQPALPAGKPRQLGHAEQVASLIERMDDAHLDLELGYRQVQEWDAAHRPGHAASQKATREAINARRGRAAAVGVGREDFDEMTRDRKEIES
jgi:hypothetical protein